MPLTASLTFRFTWVVSLVRFARYPFVSQSGEDRFVRLATGTTKELTIKYSALVDRTHELFDCDKLTPMFGNIEANYQKVVDCQPVDAE